MPRIGPEDQASDRALLELVGEVCGLLHVEELRRGLLVALKRVLPSDYVSLNEVTPGADDIATVSLPDAPEDQLARWNELAHESPLLQFYLRTQDGRAYRFSDVIEPQQLHELALFREVYVPLGVAHQMAFTLPAPPDRVLAVALSRASEDYSDSERAFADRARPFLIQAYLNALAFEALRGAHADARGGPATAALRAEGLTRREAEVLRLLALGRSNHHIAGTLGISYRTVGKHLEHAFRKLGVGDRSSAAGRVWELAGDRRTSPGVSGAVREPAQRLVGLDA